MRMQENGSFCVCLSRFSKGRTMKKLFYIDSTMREESRTRRIAEALISELGKRYEIERVSLDGADFPAVGSRILTDRNNGIVPERYADMARRLAAADRIVIAAPFWDMSFPAALKVFFENMSLFNITFGSNDRECYGLCRCEKVLYITTRGMNIHTGDALEQATPYIRAIGHLWGLGELSVVAAENMDYVCVEEIERKIEEAVRKGMEICKDF